MPEIPEQCLLCHETEWTLCQSCFHRLAAPESEPRFLARMGKYAIKFHKNLIGAVYCVVADAEASRFKSQAEVRWHIEAHRLPKPRSIELAA